MLKKPDVSNKILKSVNEFCFRRKVLEPVLATKRYMKIYTKTGDKGMLYNDHMYGI